MEYKIMHIPISPKTRQGVKITPTGITIHSTANPKSTAINERNWLVNPSNTRTASWHIAVDENMAVEAIPLNEKAIHASSTIGNNTTIGIEICESGNREKTLKNAVALVAKMLHERNWSVDRLKRHFDWNGKNCPRIFNYNNWEGWAKFKNDVQAELNRLKSPMQPKSKYPDSVDVKINYKGKPITIQGILRDGTNYIPIRTLEQFGYKVDWDSKTRTVIVK